MYLRGGMFLLWDGGFCQAGLQIPKFRADSLNGGLRAQGLRGLGAVGSLVGPVEGRSPSNLCVLIVLEVPVGVLWDFLFFSGSLKGTKFCASTGSYGRKWSVSKK